MPSLTTPAVRGHRQEQSDLEPVHNGDGGGGGSGTDDESLPPSAHEWHTGHVAQWLRAQRLGHYVELIAYQHKVDGATLLLLDESDLRQPPLQLAVLADIKRLSVAVDRLRREQGALAQRRHDAERHLRRPDAAVPLPTLSCVQSTPHMQRLWLLGRRARNEDADAPATPDSIDSDCGGSRQCHLARRSSEPKLRSNNQSTRDEFIRQVESVDTYRKSLFKAFIAGVYCQVALFVTSVTMVVVHGRVPDMSKYPPLPDLVLDNLPYIPWAFEVCEMLATVMMFIWLALLVFHKHRLIILRRGFSLVGTVFLLRSITMLITSLSVPGVHLQCAAQSYGSAQAKLLRALQIWTGLGMTIQGVRTCGDYMFSGHTTAVTLLNHFITEYTPNSWRGLHTATWVMNLFGIFFILAGHEHYSIDVFIAFYISSRMFLYYHVLASQISTHTVADERVRGWFPFLWFFESGSPSRLENEFEWPLPPLAAVLRCVGDTTRRLRDCILRSSDAWRSFVRPRLATDNGDKAAAVLKPAAGGNHQQQQSQQRDAANRQQAHCKRRRY